MPSWLLQLTVIFKSNGYSWILFVYVCWKWNQLFSTWWIVRIINWKVNCQLLWWILCSLFCVVSRKKGSNSLGRRLKHVFLGVLGNFRIIYLGNVLVGCLCLDNILKLWLILLNEKRDLGNAVYISPCNTLKKCIALVLVPNLKYRIESKHFNAGIWLHNIFAFIIKS